MTTQNKNIQIGICQPLYIPWLGYFEQIARVNVFVILDDVQFAKQSWQMRNRINFYNKYMYLSLAIQNGPTNDLINQKKIHTPNFVIQNHLKYIKTAYSKFPFFDHFFPLLSGAYSNFLHSSKSNSLLELNMLLIRFFCEYIGINTPIKLSSSLNINERGKNERLIAICKSLSANHLYDGKAAAGFIDLKLFEKNNITVTFQNYTHPAYKCFNKVFIPYLSIIDLLMSTTPAEAIKIICSGGEM